MFAPDHSEFDMQTAAGSNNTWLSSNPNCTASTGCLQPSKLGLAFVPDSHYTSCNCARPCSHWIACLPASLSFVVSEIARVTPPAPPTPRMLQAIQMTWSLQLMMPEQQSQHGPTHCDGWVWRTFKDSSTSTSDPSFPSSSRPVVAAHLAYAKWQFSLR